MDSDGSEVFEEDGDQPTDLVSPSRGVREHDSLTSAGYLFPRAPRCSSSRRRSSSNPALKVESAVSCDSENEILMLPIFDPQLDEPLVDAEGKYLKNSGLAVPEPLSHCDMGEDLDQKTSPALQRSPAIRRSPLPFLSQKPRLRRRSVSLPNYSEELTELTLATVDHTELDLYDAVVGEEEDGTGPFSSLQLLTKHPAHLACFLRFHFDDDDMEGSGLECLLFHVLVHVYRHQDVWGNWKEVRGFGQSVFDLFFASNATLVLDVDEARVSEMMAALEQKDADQEILAVFDSAAETVVRPMLARSLGRYNGKRMMGFGSLYGESELRGADPGSEAEKEAVRNILVPVLDHLIRDLPADRTHEPTVSRKVDMLKILLSFIVSSGVSMGGWIADSAKKVGKQRKNIKPFLFAFRSGHQRLPEHAVRSQSPKARLSRWAQNIIRQSSLDRKSPTATN